ncbi:hypothetical protein BC567DRAFT_234277 [Phyllosticta citribraziliensis]
MLLCLGRGFQIAIESVCPRLQTHCAMTRPADHGGHANADAPAPTGKRQRPTISRTAPVPEFLVLMTTVNLERQSGAPRQKRPIGADDASSIYSGSRELGGRRCRLSPPKRLTLVFELESGPDRWDDVFRGSTPSYHPERRTPNQRGWRQSFCATLRSLIGELRAVQPHLRGPGSERQVVRCSARLKPQQRTYTVGRDIMWTAQ